MKAFLSDPEKFSTKASLLPRNKPRLVFSTEAKEVTEAQLGFNGYCSVSFGKALEQLYRKDYTGVVKGDPKIMAEYNDKYYSFTSEEYRALFMR